MRMRFIIVSKPEDLIKNITFAWHGIGEEWYLDMTDLELICLN